MSTLAMPDAELTYIIAHMGPLTENEIYDYFFHKYPNTQNIGLAIEYLEDRMIIECDNGYYRLVAAPEDSVNKFYALSIEDYLPEDMNDISIEVESLRQAFALFFKLALSAKTSEKKQILCWTDLPWTYFTQSAYQQEILKNLIQNDELEVHYAFNRFRSPLHKELLKVLSSNNRLILFQHVSHMRKKTYF